MDKARTKIDELIAECLVQAGLILQEQLEYAKRQQQKSGKLLEDIFIEQGLVTKDKILYFKDIVTLPLVNHSNLEMSGDSHYHNLNYLISAKSFFKTLLKIIFFLIIAHLTTQLLQRFTHDFPLRDSFVTLFDLDGELNFPSLYSALALLFCSIILGVIASIKKKQDDIYTIYWQGLSVIFSFLCFDELASLHERLVEPVRTTLNTKGFLYFAWVIPGTIGVLVLLLIFSKFIINLPRKTRSNFLVAGLIYLSGAIGCELIGGYILDSRMRGIFYLIIITLEESLEMLGIAVFIYGLLSHISYCTSGTMLTIKVPGEKLRRQNYLS